VAAGAQDVVTFDDVNTTLARAGVTIGGSLRPIDKLHLAPFVHVSAWRELGKPASAHATIAAANQSFVAVTERVGSFGQVGAGMDFKLHDTPFQGFVRGDLRFGQKAHGKAVNVGMKMRF
jgi:outer membrane autotransporter protein